MNLRAFLLTLALAAWGSEGASVLRLRHALQPEALSIPSNPTATSPKFAIVSRRAPPSRTYVQSRFVMVPTLHGDGVPTPLPLSHWPSSLFAPGGVDLDAVSSIPGLPLSLQGLLGPSLLPAFSWPLLLDWPPLAALLALANGIPAHGASANGIISGGLPNSNTSLAVVIPANATQPPIDPRGLLQLLGLVPLRPDGASAAAPGAGARPGSPAIAYPPLTPTASPAQPTHPPVSEEPPGPPNHPKLLGAIYPVPLGLMFERDV